MYGSSLFRLARTSSVRYFKNGSNKKLLEFLANMPKANTARIAEAQQQRQTISKKGEKYGPSTVYLQVLGSGARGVPNTLYLFTDQKRYLFNCGECTQRLAHEHKVKLSRLEHVFITSKTWKNIGGLPGLSLTLQDVGVPKITLHGPEGLDVLYNATKRFVIMKEMQVTMAPSSPTEDFEDNVMTIKYVHLLPQLTLLPDIPPQPAKRARLDDVLSLAYDQFIHDKTDYYKRGTEGEGEGKTTPRSARSPGIINDKVDHGRGDKKSRRRRPLAIRVQVTIDSHRREKNFVDLHTSIAYICTLKKRLGTLDLAKCVEKGVPPGPLLGQLKSGIDVVLPGGTLVLSKDVKTPDDPGPVFIILEVPEISYLSEEQFAAHFDNGTNSPESIPTVIVHLSPPEVFHHKNYQDFMTKFGPTTRHLILNSQNSCLGSEAVHRTQHKLHLLDPEVFPLLKDPSIPADWGTVPKTNSPTKIKGIEDLKNRIAIAQFQNIINAEIKRSPPKETAEEDEGQKFETYSSRTLTMFHLRPKREIDSPTILERLCTVLQQDNLDNLMPSPPVETAEEEGAQKLETYSSRTLTMFHLRPKREIDRSAEPKLHVQDYYQETMDVEGFAACLAKFREEAQNLRFKDNYSSNEYPKIVFLGTGSCIPSKTRNTSAIILHVDDQSTILLDCGEGTFGQLVRFYGPRKVDGLLRTLKAIYISHLHADHHIGLIGVLQARAAALANAPEKNTPLLLLAPGQIVTWLTMYDSQFEKIDTEFTLIPNQNLMDPKEPGLTPAALASIGLDSVLTCLVPHCPNAFGVAITAAGHKITYSGDTLPTENLVNIGEYYRPLVYRTRPNTRSARHLFIEPGLTPAALASIGLDSVLTCLVPHCPNAFGVAITAAGHKITYSGDTLPTENLVNIGQDSTILIHEATMEDELADEARIKMHSTTSQAIEIGRKMNAKYTVLTHFSQRYARLPRINTHIFNEHNVGIAFDNMQVTLSDLPLLPHMYAPLQHMFAEHCVDMELKAASRVRRKEKSSNTPTPANTSLSGTRQFSTGNTAHTTDNVTNEQNVKETVDSVAQIKDNIENVAIESKEKQT
ncbi:ribonuclease Z, mitochondrial [Cydia amplana]|uniref:ribonuclease Z, mitochondrial n=1 Tax=Cydia amplana TaxID=1869771 RepID=UPI002FE61154